MIIAYIEEDKRDRIVHALNDLNKLFGYKTATITLDKIIYEDCIIRTDNRYIRLQKRNIGLDIKVKDIYKIRYIVINFTIYNINITATITSEGNITRMYF